MKVSSGSGCVGGEALGGWTAATAEGQSESEWASDIPYEELGDHISPCGGLGPAVPPPPWR